MSKASRDSEILLKRVEEAEQRRREAAQPSSTAATGETPRTDASAEYAPIYEPSLSCSPKFGYDVVSADFARQLERELAEVKKAHAEAIEQWSHWEGIAKSHPSAIEAPKPLYYIDGHEVYQAGVVQAALSSLTETFTLPADILAVCKARGWNLNWQSRGVYLHLEASELIEALRGKHGEPLKEAADVLLVLMSITENAALPWESVVAQAKAICNDLRTKPRYHGEAFAEAEERRT